MLWIEIGLLLLFSCAPLIPTTAIPLEDFFDFGEEFGDERNARFTYLGSELVYVSKGSHVRALNVVPGSSKSLPPKTLVAFTGLSIARAMPYGLIVFICASR